MNPPSLATRSKHLLQLLLLSGALNIALASTFFYFFLQDRESHFQGGSIVRPGKEAKLKTVPNELLVRAYSTLSFQELTGQLQDRELAQDGFRRRDLALSCLVAFHHFDIDRALSGLKLEKRHVAFTGREGTEVIALPLFASLQDYHYAAIARFLECEKWPVTPRGLFYEIQRAREGRDPTLDEAFALTSEFQTVRLLFLRSGIDLKREHFIALFAQGEWEPIRAVAEALKQGEPFHPDLARGFLMQLIERRSAFAAYLLTSWDPDYAFHRLSDEQLLMVFDLLPAQHRVGQPLAQAILTSPRSDHLKLRASRWLGLVAPPPQELAPLPVAAAPEPVQETVAASASAVHVVQKNESLWKIARKYKVSVEALKKQNNLDTDRVREGKKLEIPKP